VLSTRTVLPTAPCKSLVNWCAFLPPNDGCFAQVAQWKLEQKFTKPASLFTTERTRQDASSQRCLFYPLTDKEPYLLQRIAKKPLTSGRETCFKSLSKRNSRVCLCVLPMRTEVCYGSVSAKEKNCSQFFPYPYFYGAGCRWAIGLLLAYLYFRLKSNNTFETKMTLCSPSLYCLVLPSLS
jgi:hypothetical protein